MAVQVNMDFFGRTIQVGSVTSIWWVQLSTAIIFGLTFATLITLILTPALLAAPTVWKNRWHEFRESRGGAGIAKRPDRGTEGFGQPAE